MFQTPPLKARYLPHARYELHVAGRYEDGSPKLVLHSHTGLAMTLTVHMPLEITPGGAVWIKDYSENEGIAVALERAGMIGPPVNMAQTGHVEVMLHYLASEVANEVYWTKEPKE